MISQPHTPTTGQVETGFALYLYDYENIVVSAGRDRFKAWLAARDARIEAAAEQRGAERAIRKAAREYESTHEISIKHDEVIDFLDTLADEYRADQIEVCVERS